MASAARSRKNEKRLIQKKYAEKRRILQEELEDDSLAISSEEKTTDHGKIRSRKYPVSDPSNHWHSYIDKKYYDDLVFFPTEARKILDELFQALDVSFRHIRRAKISVTIGFSANKNVGGFHIYFGGKKFIYPGLGEGHGHITFSENGELVYFRNENKPHGCQNFTDVNGWEFYFDPRKLSRLYRLCRLHRSEPLKKVE